MTEPKTIGYGSEERKRFIQTRELSSETFFPELRGNFVFFSHGSDISSRHSLRSLVWPQVGGILLTPV